MLLHLLTTGYGTKRQTAATQRLGRNRSEADMGRQPVGSPRALMTPNWTLVGWNPAQQRAPDSILTRRDTTRRLD